MNTTDTLITLLADKNECHNVTMSQARGGRTAGGK
jgi:hypothetical protein